MREESVNNVSSCRSRPGIVLLMTLVLLVVLSTLGYTLSNILAVHRHRAQYIIDYQAARYGCDSAVKYALASLEDISPELVSRPNEPDFSHLFCLTDEEYKELLAEWADRGAFKEDEGFNYVGDANSVGDMNDIDDFDDINDIGDFNDFDDFDDFDDIDSAADFNDPNSFRVRGPYGPAWPFVSKPVEFEIGSAKVRIEIEDENAKYPIGWMLLNDKTVEREVIAGFETFCEWMDVNEVQIDLAEKELKEVTKIKQFKLAFKPLTRRTMAGASTKGGRRRKVRRGPRRISTTTVSVTKQLAEQAADFAKLFHSSLIDTEALARPTMISRTRKESLLKYMGIWGSGRVNINTAPRHVLEAAFAFGGDADKIAEEIIRRRREEPFKGIDDLRESLFRYADSIDKCEKYITTVSKFFTVRITAVSGVAEASAVIAITKEGKGIDKIAVISG